MHSGLVTTTRNKSQIVSGHHFSGLLNKLPVFFAKLISDFDMSSLIIKLKSHFSLLSKKGCSLSKNGGTLCLLDVLLWLNKQEW